MIDVHSHIVFDVDDGPKTLEESLDLIGESYAQGVCVRLFQHPIVERECLKLQRIKSLQTFLR